MCLITDTTPSDESKISGNWRSSLLSYSDMAYPDGQILSTPTLRIFSFSELQNATRNFGVHSLLGEGRFGQIYRGRLDEKVTSNNDNGFTVAVKKLDYQGIRRFEYCQVIQLTHIDLFKKKKKLSGSLNHPFGSCYRL